MKYFKICLIILIFAAVFSQKIAYSIEHIISESVLGNGFSSQTGSNYHILGTAGQSTIGVASSSLHINEVGFWYLNIQHFEPIVVEDNTLPKQFKLLGNFPNPFNPSTEIRYEVPKQYRVTLRIYSISGQHVSTLIDKTVSAGSHTIKWSPKGLAAGVYLYSLEAGDKRLIDKMLLLK